MAIPLNYTVQVQEGWVDYNGHMNDAEYAKVFSKAGFQMMLSMGITREKLNDYNYTYFTLETHICYLKEILLGEKVQLEWQLIDFDHKRMHVFFRMKKEDGTPVATSEQMVIGVSSETRKSASFPGEFLNLIEEAWMTHKELDKPKEIGRVIGIKR
ncbi:thioesterase family protein [Piscibacillus salipiscarius]|uniref:Thioesterase family protein n=1 Tax=Piscibacillus salipiscarius TaxID=299480 RepID=A0ABW5Q7Y2_9BACI